MKKTTRPELGFTLIELLVSLAVFLVIGGVALQLVSKNLPLYNRQQSATALNIGLRSAVAQLQLDMVNSGTGFYVGASIPSWPIGLSVINNVPSSSCYDPATKIYGSSCFDTLNVIAADPSTAPSHPNPPGASCVSTSTSSILFADPPPGVTAAAYASHFADGDQVMVV